MREPPRRRHGRQGLPKAQRYNNKTNSLSYYSINTIFLSPEELHRSTCWYLDCSRYWLLLTPEEESEDGSGGEGGGFFFGGGDEEGERGVPLKLFLSVFGGLVINCLFLKGAGLLCIKIKKTFLGRRPGRCLSPRLAVFLALLGGRGRRRRPEGERRGARVQLPPASAAAHAATAAATTTTPAARPSQQRVRQPSALAAGSNQHKHTYVSRFTL